MRDLPIKLGDKLAGKYRVLRLLGQGGMGVVYLAEHERLGRQVAIKVLHTQTEQMQVAIARFEREVRAMAQINSRHVAQAFDADVLEDGSPFLVMEYLNGRDLRAELKLRRMIPYREAVAYIVQTCEGVAAVHDVGIIHRDLKPNNLFVTDLEAARCVKVLDFGIVKLLSGLDTTVTAESVSVGTPLYMSPEQLSGKGDISPRSDVWALGVVLYELIAGVSPFAADRPGSVVAAIMLEQPALLSRIVSGVPEVLAETISDALVKSPAGRIGSVRELSAKIAPFGLPSDKIFVDTSTLSGRPVPAPKRHSRRPDLSSLIQDEVERRDIAAGRGNNPRVDQIRQLPSLARLSIPLTNAASPRALQAAIESAEQPTEAATPDAVPPIDALARLDAPSNVEASVAALRTTAEAIQVAPNKRKQVAAIVALACAVLAIGFWSKLPQGAGVVSAGPNSIGSSSADLSSIAAATQTSGSVVPPTPTAALAPSLALTSSPAVVPSLRLDTTGQKPLTGTPVTVRGPTTRSSGMASPPPLPSQRPRGALPALLPNTRDSNPVHL